VLGRDGHATVRNDPFLAAAMARPTLAGPVGAVGARTRLKVPSDRKFRTELARLRRVGAISSAAYQTYLGSFNAALAVERRLRRTRAREL
jgi:hypothetical protein